MTSPRRAERAPKRIDLRRDERGVVAVEFVLVLPLILLVLFIMLDFGRLFYHLNDANQVSASVARQAAVNRYPTDAGQDRLPNGTKVCVDFPAGAAIGNPVRVKTEGVFTLVPFLSDALNIGTVPIKGGATMRLERTPTYSAGCT